jgi:hypothetical protein
MGINFLYIGRDESTLKDKLRIESGMDELPLEFNLTSAFGMSFGNNTNTFNVSSILSQWGMPAGFNISKFIPGVPAGFNASDPYVDAPFPPFQLPKFNMSSFLPGIPGLSGLSNALSISNPLILSLSDTMLKTFLPNLPKDFSLSKIYVPGGIILSEMETLFTAMRDSPWMKAFGSPPFGGLAFGGPGTGVLTRSLYQLGFGPESE